MKKFIVFVLFQVCSVIGFAAEYSEVGLFTDRDIYVSGETLLAKIYVPQDHLSGILYLDLVNERGTRILGVSLDIKNDQADGYLQLPDSLSSGSYQVRAYEKYNAKRLKVVREIWISNRFDGLEKNNRMNRIVCESIKEQKTDQIRINHLEPVVQTGHKIHAEVSISQSLIDQIEGGVSVCVAQADTLFQSVAFLAESDQRSFGVVEKKGVVISGTVLSRKTSSPASGITVYLAIPDSIPGLQYYKTKSDGKFYFLLDQLGRRVDAFVECFREVPTEPLKIKMDDLFAESGSDMKYSQQPIPEELKNNLLRNMDVVTFQKVFNQNRLLLSSALKKARDVYPYYGEASSTVDPQLFVDLPNFAEISREFLVGVKFRNYNNEPTIRVLNSATRKYFEESPLVLLDGIPVRDFNIIKDFGSTDIDRVDVCLNERFYGNLRFPGVVAIYSTKPDYAHIPESDQLVHLSLDTGLPSYSVEAGELLEPNVPDLRQVLYWNPFVNKNQKLLIDFKTSSVNGLYKIVVRGRLKDGTLVSTEKQFEVK